MDVRNPSWSREELILSLDFYFKNPNPPKTCPELKILAEVIRNIALSRGARLTENLRNAGGVYLKLQNWKAHDPSYRKDGKKGMTRGNKLEPELWDQYANDPEKLRLDAQAIRDAVSLSQIFEPPASSINQEYESEEGSLHIVLHKRYERDAKLVREKKKAAQGSLVCEACDFDFAARYGALGEGYIEVHHLKPVHKMQEGQKTKLSDLALLCANCHRMAHRSQYPLSIEELKASIKEI